MSQEEGRRMSQGGGSKQRKLQWQGQPWGLLNSNKSAGGERRAAVKLPESGSSSPSVPASNSQPGPKVTVGTKRGRDGASKSSSSKDGSHEGKAAGESDHEMHVWTERERRRKMSNMFTSLHALLPHLPPKVLVFHLYLIFFFSFPVEKLLLFSYKEEKSGAAEDLKGKQCYSIGGGAYNSTRWRTLRHAAARARTARMLFVYCFFLLFFK